jgi:phosphohistidine phosphatase SixA
LPRFPLLVAGLLTCTALALVAWRSLPSPQSEPPSSGLFAQKWARGGVILLVRHMERCDRSEAPCLGDAEGITARAGQLATQLGSTITRLGLAATDIYSSPSLRTAQTADLMFGKPIVRQEWLSACNSENFAEQILSHKAADRNMVLVTHSECFDRLRENLKASEADTPEYGSTLVLYDRRDPQLNIAGKVETDEWLELLDNPNAS